MSGLQHLSVAVRWLPFPCVGPLPTCTARPTRLYSERDKDGRTRRSHVHSFVAPRILGFWGSFFSVCVCVCVCVRWLEERWFAVRSKETKHKTREQLRGGWGGFWQAARERRGWSVGEAAEVCVV